VTIANKHISTTNNPTTIEILLETIVSAWSVPRSYTEGNWVNQVQFCMGVCERGFERVKLRISTVRSRCQGTTDENTAGWETWQIYCGYL
jgi:hypothetical protein